MSDLLPSETITLSEEERQQLRRDVRELCDKFGNEYWRELDPDRKYRKLCIDAVTQGRYLSLLIQEDCGGLKMLVSDVINSESNTGGNCIPTGNILRSSLTL